MAARWRRTTATTTRRQPDGNLFVYALCDLDPTWIAAAQHYHWVLVLHSPRLGLGVPPSQDDAEHQRTTELATARKESLVTGGLMQWGQVRTP
jgi:hypothetical protein